MRRELKVVIVAASSMLACRLLGGSEPAGGQAVEPAAPLSSGLAQRVGEVLELVVPLWGGGVQDLAQLRGRPVLLELADAASPGREAAQARYRALVQQQSELAVVSVALDADAAGLPEAWTDDRPPFILGWDPQGALAARLQLVVLPTVVLLDEAGTIVAVHEGTPPDEAALERWLHAG